jgi:chemotaxis protein MotB
VTWQPGDPEGLGLRRDPARTDVVGLFGRTASAGWMVTFADLLALLVSFFVLLFATTTVEPDAWRRVVQPMRPYLAGTVLHPQDKAPVVSATPPAGHDLNYLEVLLRQLHGKDPILNGMGIDRREHALVLHMPAGLLRAGLPGTADLGRLLGALDNRLEIVAHGPAGSAALAGAAAPDTALPWRRVLLRAQTVADMLAGEGVTQDMTVTGLVDLPAASPMRIDLVVHDRRTDATKGDGHAP